MSFIVENWMLLAVALTSGVLLLLPSFKGLPGGIDASEAVRLINREKAVVLDVSSPQEFAEGHIQGARNVPLDEIEAKLAGVVKNKALPLVLVCASGVRSRRAQASARKLGYENTHILAGGMGAWRAANMPVVKG